MPKSEQILPSDDRAATKITAEVWLSGSGRIYLDERTARWDGATHVCCDKCARPIKKGSWALCETCRENKAWERWNTAPKVEWDGNTLIFSDAVNEYFFDMDSLLDYCDDGENTPENLRLYLCQPNYGREIDGDHFAEDLPEDGELPDELIEAMAVFNQAIRNCGPLSWSPGDTAVTISNNTEVE